MNMVYASEVTMAKMLDYEPKTLEKWRKDKLLSQGVEYIKTKTGSIRYNIQNMLKWIESDDNDIEDEILKRLI